MTLTKFLVLFGLISTPFEISAQTLLSQADSVSPTTVRLLLGQPGGLEKAAQSAKHVYIHISSSSSQQLDLVALQSLSSLIVIGKCIDHQSTWDSVTNLVSTSYTFAIDKVVKGIIAKQTFIFTVSGGVLAFSDVAIAQVDSIEYSSLALGVERVLFLTQSADGISITNGIEGIFSVDLQTGRVFPMARYDRKPHLLTSQDFGVLASFLPKILAPETQTANSVK